jgi:bifunctional NMN adenylyltransferase/nudix hydrolase
MPAFHNDLSATSIREKWLRGVREKDLEVPNGVQQFLKRLPVERGDKLAEEAAFLREYKKQWSTTPYPVIFTTVDTVVTKGPYVLLVTRDALPGKGLKALPGGFLDPEERILDGAIRELKEETSIEVPPTVLRKSVVNNKVFDAVGRSKRGRTITHAFHINLDSEKTVGLPAIKAQKGETRKVNWVSLAWCIRNGEEFFEDHLQIIRYFTGI